MRFFLTIFLSLIMRWADAGLPLNCPYKQDNIQEKVSYLYLDTYPDNLDPILSYEVEKNSIISQIYEPLYTMVYQSKPYRIGPHIAKEMPKIIFLDAKMQVLAKQDEAKAVYTSYTIPIRQGIYYQPHPGFCQVLKLKSCQGFLRELHAEDFAYQIKRIGQINSNSPYAAVLSKFILGFKEYQKTTVGRTQNWYDLRQDEIKGVRVVDDYTLELITQAYSNQWMFWLTMSFLAPMPWEIDEYHHDFSLDKTWVENSIGTGPYMLLGNRSNQYVELKKNPHFRKEYFHFPDGVKQIPVIDRYLMLVEKERIPRWNKFLQGYFDSSTIPSESFQNTIQVNSQGQFSLSPSLKNKKIHLDIEESAYVSGVVFNFLDPVVGGYDLKAQKLRRAISLAFDFEEYRTIFRSGRGQIAQDPLPPIILPNKDEIIGENQYLYQANHQKKSISYAKKLLAEAGYPGGVDPKTHKSLVLNFDQVSQGQPEEKALFLWFRKQMAKLGVQLNIRETDMNRYHQKLLNSAHQMTFFIWSADFPNPENFLMLFYGPNRLAKLGGSNWANYDDPKYNQMYQRLETLASGDERNHLIRKMVKLLQQQGVWVWATYGESFYILQDWTYAQFIQEFSSGLFKYNDIDLAKRRQAWLSWNQPVLWPLGVGFILILVILLPFIWELYQRNHALAVRANQAK